MGSLKSRKLWVTVSAMGLLVIKAWFPELEDLNTVELIGLVSAYLVGQGVADFGKEAAKISSDMQ